MDSEAVIRKRWAQFLQPLLGGRVTDAGVPLYAEIDALRTRLMRDRMGYRNATLDLPAMDDYMAAKPSQTVTPRRAYWLGEALRAYGYEWCSGIVALVAAARLEAQMDLLERVATATKSPSSAHGAGESTLTDAAADAQPYVAALLTVALAPLALAEETSYREAARSFLQAAAEPYGLLWFRALEYGKRGSDRWLVLARTALAAPLPFAEKAAVAQDIFDRFLEDALLAHRETICFGVRVSEALAEAMRFRREHKECR